MNNEFLEAIEIIARDRGISREVLIETIESALVSAYKLNFGSSHKVSDNIDRESGDVRVFAIKNVVEQVEDDTLEVGLEEARKINRAYEPGDLVEFEVTPKSFGRIAAQTAKQVVMQRIREAERGMIFDEYIEKENEVLTAIVQRIEKKNVYVELGKAEGVLLPSEHMPGEEYQINDRLKVYVVEVKKTNKGPQVMVSRTHPGLVKRLFELEVPEIHSGVVQIKSISREAGSRTKMAVYSSDEAIDPVGACVGQRGTRVERIVEELKGEKIDIIKWNADPIDYIANSLSPARVIMVQVLEDEHAARVIVPDSQLSLAIGKEGQNARLAAKLTGWKIDIKSQSQAQALLMAEDAGEEVVWEDEPLENFEFTDAEE